MNISFKRQRQRHSTHSHNSVDSDCFVVVFWMFDIYCLSVRSRERDHPAGSTAGGDTLPEERESEYSDNRGQGVRRDDAK